jgi:beta-catenin-like protein 1
MTEEQDEEGEELDALALKRMLLSFEKRVSRNQEMRVKYPDAPDKFMESELELNEEIQKLHVIATVPELYHVMVETNSVQTLLGLLHHENTDISLAVVDLLQEMSDVDTLTESEEGADVLMDTLLKGQIVGLLVQLMERLNETVTEEAEGIHNTLAIVENMSELKNEEVMRAAGEQGLVKWLMKRIAVRQYDANKLYASEILAILLQSHQENQKLLGDLNGVDILLQALSYYKKRDPTLSDEMEAMDNLFDCMCSSLMYPPNRTRFLEGEGPQLMLLMLKGKKLAAKPRALKVLNHAMSGIEGAPNCTKFIDIYGLRSLFPSFMKIPKARKGGPAQVETEEHVCSIIASLLHHTKGQVKERLYGKFTENDHEKVDRLLELHFNYLSRVQEVDKQIRREKASHSRHDNEEEAESEDALYLRRLDGGLFTLQLVDYIILDLCTSGVASIRERIARILRTRSSSLSFVKRVMEEYADNLGDEGQDSDQAENSERRKILDKLKRL